MLELISITKLYGATRALGPLDLRIAAGSTTVLIGPSGSGKSTLLRLLLGLTEPSSGTIRVDGEELGHADLARVRRRFGYVVPILTGIRLDDVGLILEGAVPAALLALAVQSLFDVAEWTLVSPALQSGEHRG